MKAIVFVYKRPELTKRIVLRIDQINSEYKRKYHKNAISQIILVHDGIREEEDNRSKNFHQEARELCLYLERTHPQVSTLIFEDNVGLTNHMFRIVESLEGSVRDYILLEEDKAPTFEGIEFLLQTSKAMDPRALVDTSPFNKHLDQKITQISTLYTDNGNMTIGDELYDLVKQLWIVKDKYQGEFEKNMQTYLSSFLSGFSLKRAYGYCTKSYAWGLTNIDRPDSLLTYALILSKKFKACPPAPLSENWSDQDYRGKNVNTVPVGRGSHCSSQTIKIWDVEVCPKCERQGVSERVALTLFSAIRTGLIYRINKL